MKRLKWVIVSVNGAIAACKFMPKRTYMHVFDTEKQARAYCRKRNGVKK